MPYNRSYSHLTHIGMLFVGIFIGGYFTYKALELRLPPHVEMPIAQSTLEKEVSDERMLSEK